MYNEAPEKPLARRLDSLESRLDGEVGGLSTLAAYPPTVSQSRRSRCLISLWEVTSPCENFLRVPHYVSRCASFAMGPLHRHSAWEPGTTHCGKPPTRVVPRSTSAHPDYAAGSAGQPRSNQIGARNCSWPFRPNRREIASPKPKQGGASMSKRAIDLNPYTILVVEGPPMGLKKFVWR